MGSKKLDVQSVVDKEDQGRLLVTYGVFFSPSEFIQRVQGIRHPFDIPLPLDEANMSAISFLLENGPAKVAEHRAAKLRHYLKRAKELKLEELEAGVASKRWMNPSGPS